MGINAGDSRKEAEKAGVKTSVVHPHSIWYASNGGVGRKLLATQL